MKNTNKTNGVFEIGVLDVREQIQEDVLAYVEDKLADDCYKDKFKDDLCQIVVNNFKKLEIEKKIFDTPKIDEAIQNYLDRQEFFEDTKW